MKRRKCTQPLPVTLLTGYLGAGKTTLCQEVEVGCRNGIWPVSLRMKRGAWKYRYVDEESDKGENI